MRPLQHQPWLPLTTARAVVDPSAIAAAATTTATAVLVSSIQDFRDGFRALFLPGFAIVSFSLPLILIGLVVNSGRRGGGSGGSTGSGTEGANGRLTKATQGSTPPPPPPLPSLSSLLLFKLLASILIDLVGDGSLLVPGAGDASDLLWAPLSAVLVRLLYGSNTLALCNLIEELLPFTDAIPTATIAFLLDYFFRKAEAEDSARWPGAARRDDRDVVDVRATRVDEKD